MLHINIISIPFTAMIHTLEITSDCVMLTDIEITAKPYVSKFYICGGKAVYRLNPNKFQGAIYSSDMFNQILCQILQELQIQNYSIRRVDVAFDTLIPYDEIYKICSYIKELYAIHLNTTNSYYTNGSDFTKRSLKVTTRSYELEIYNKALESIGHSPASTRIEFRYKRVNKSLDSVPEVLAAIEAVIRNLPSHIPTLEDMKIAQLIEQQKKEGITNSTKGPGFREFICKYADFIYSMPILKGLHDAMYSGKCKDWLYRYRTSGRTMDLICKTDIKNFTSCLLSALDQYLKGTAEQSLLKVS